jgi:hypothetical protein
MGLLGVRSDLVEDFISLRKNPHRWSGMERSMAQRLVSNNKKC